MSNGAPILAFPVLTLSAALLAAAAAAGLVFALWAENGTAMFAALVQSGLALCF